MNKTIISLALGSLFVSSAFANPISNPEISVVLDGYYQDGERNNSEREEGFGLGHTELGLSANIDDKFYGALTAVLESMVMRQSSCWKRRSLKRCLCLMV